MDQTVFDHDGAWTEDAYLALTETSVPRVELVEGTLFVGPRTSPARARVVARIRETMESALPDGLRVVGPVPLRLGPDCVLLPDLVVTRTLPEPEAPDGVSRDDGSSDGAGPEGADDVGTGTDGAGSARSGSDAVGPVSAGPENAGPDPAPTAPQAAGPDGGASQGASVPDTGSDAPVGGAATRPDPAPDPGDAPVDRIAEMLDAADALMVVEVVGREHGATDRSFKPQLYARSRIPYSLLVDHDGPFAIADMIIGGRYHQYARAADGEALRVEEPFPLEIDLAAVTGADEHEPAVG